MNRDDKHPTAHQHSPDFLRDNMASKAAQRRKDTIQLVLAGLLLYISIKIICFVQLVILYGWADVFSKGLGFVSMQPRLVVSNGDIPPSPNSLLNFIAFSFTWALFCILLMPILTRWLNLDSNAET